jgi:predicted transcriptional regulator
MELDNEGADVVSAGASKERRDELHSNNTPSVAATQPLTEALSCPTCGRVFKTDTTVSRLLECIADFPGLSGWELSQLTGLDYREASRGLRKARAWGAVEWEEEARESGGVRFRYRVAADWESGGVA